MDIKALRPRGFGSFSQAVQLLALALSFYTLIEGQSAQRAADAARNAAMAEGMTREQEIDKDVNTKISRLWDGQRDQRRDVEVEFRREIDLACACCRTRTP